MTKSQLTDFSAKLNDWFWEKGQNREMRYQLSPSGWLYRLYTLSERIEALPPDASTKPAFGLWGPSQVGKSTLLSFYLDLGADERGDGSPLQWAAQDPIRFERTGQRTDIVALNPYNLKSDASACITRFRLAEEVFSDRHPVEVKLAKSGQVLHSMALGYLSDWGQNQGNHLNDDALREILSALGGNSRKPSRDAYLVSFETAALLDLLTTSRLLDARYAGLSARAGSRVLESKAAISDKNTAVELQRKLFWSNVPALTQLHQQLEACVERVHRICPESKEKIFCSYQVAACFLDMASYLRAVGGIDMQGSRVEPDSTEQSRLLGIRYKAVNGSMVLSFDAGEPLFENIHQFAHLQALAWELIVPVKRARLKQLGEDGYLLLRLLEQADILDFPGVSNVGTGGDDRLSQDIVAKNGSHLLFSHFLKRGKTSAMVAATARWGSIDGFCLMFRTMGPIARPGIISEGIRTWWNFTTGEDINTHSKDGPPINIVLTFFAEFLNDLIRNPQIQRFGIAFEKLRSLGAISSPNVSKYFTAIFPKYEELALPTEGKQAVIETIVERIMADPETATLFRDGGMIRRMIYGNGVSTVIEALVDQAAGVSASRSMEKRRVKVELEFLQMIDEAAPGESSEDFRRKELLSRWSQNIRTRLGANVSFDPKISEVISQGLRKLLTVLPEDLDSIPINIVEARRNTSEYVQVQLSKWIGREHSGSYPLGKR